MRKAIYISFLLLGLFSAAQAQKKIIYEDTSLLQKEETIAAPVEERIVEDNTIIDSENTAAEESEEEKTDTTLRSNNLQMPYDSIKNWRNSKDYAYTKYLDSLLKNMKQPDQATSAPPGGGLLNGILNSGFVRLVLWGLFIFFVLFIIYRLFLADGAFQRKTRSARNGEAEVAEELITNESDFDALIRTALQTGKYRQAVRYQYLRTLHMLAGKNLIELAPDKPNSQYVHEIANPSHRQDFAKLTLNYEYVWYGEFDIEKNIYQKIENNFTSLNQKL